MPHDLVSGGLQGPLPAGEIEIMRNHQANQFPEGDARLPSQLTAGFGGVAAQEINLTGPEITGISFDVFPPIQAAVRRRAVQEIAHRM